MSSPGVYGGEAEVDQRGVRVGRQDGVGKLEYRVRTPLEASIEPRAEGGESKCRISKSAAFVPAVTDGDQDHIMAPLRLGNLNQVPACVVKDRRRDIAERGRRLYEFDAETFEAGVFGLDIFNAETRERNAVLDKSLFERFDGRVAAGFQ